ncbi:MAG: histidine kinase [Gammaproteobacteria bacterium]|nr:histidine kinase [Gammaproteobacteria bacterium]MDE2460373.1 histidine kinase [Gammaproteobacteria bacterium]
MQASTHPNDNPSWLPSSRLAQLLQRPTSAFRRRLLIVLLVSVPLWIYAATWDITTMLFDMAVDAKGGVVISDVVQQILVRLPLFPLLVAAYLIATGFSLQHHKTGRFLFWQLTVAVTFLLLTYPILVISYYSVHHAFDATLTFAKVMHDYMHWQYWMGTMIQYSIVYLLGLVLLFGLNAFLRYKSEQVRAAHLESKWLEARLGTLRGQLNPHFLFNALNAIVALIHMDPDRAENLLTELSALLRRSLAESFHEFTTVKDELYFVERYLAVMKARYEDRLDVALKLDQQVSDYVIPTFLLVPLVENAIKHGVAKAPVRDTVEISGRYKDDHLTFMVTNRTPTVADDEDERDETSGVGLKNTRLRLSAIYGDDYRLECGADGKGRWRSSVSIPLRNAPDLAYLTTPAG